MSKAERDLLKQLGLQQQDVAKAIDRTPQRVSQGLRQKDWYLTPDALRGLYLYLLDKDESKAAKFSILARKIVPTKAHQAAFDEPPVPGKKDPLVYPDTSPRPWQEATEEMWLFTSRPKEIEDFEYQTRMESEFFAKPNAGAKKHSLTRIVYFVPPIIVSHLCRYLNDAFRQIPPEKRLEVVVVEAAATSVCPKFIILDPLSNKPLGYVLGEAGGPDVYVGLSSNQIKEILDGLKEAGVGGRKPTNEEKGKYDFVIVPPFRPTEPQHHDLNFKIVFHSQDKNIGG